MLFNIPVIQTPVFSVTANGGTSPLQLEVALLDAATDVTLHQSHDGGVVVCDVDSKLENANTPRELILYARCSAAQRRTESCG